MPVLLLKAISISGSVGRGGVNKSADVKAVQTRLNELMPPSKQKLKVDGFNGPKTEAMIADFQKAVVKFNFPDARVDTNNKTIAALNDPNSAAVWASASKRKRVNLHFRSIALTNVPFEEQFKAAVDVYAQYNIDVSFLSGKSCLISERL